ncbi:hypothetical protein DIPPA_23761 [Diplonema papillatum]|nr:hypothetical protein DIPPA_23761 [Diplonema papillatum]
MQVSKWSVDDVCCWLGESGLSHLQGVMSKNKVDGSTLMSLTKTDLKEELGIDALKDRKDLWAKVEEVQRVKMVKLKRDKEREAPRAGTTPPPPSLPGRKSPTARATTPPRVSTSPTPRMESPKPIPANKLTSMSCDYCFKKFIVSDTTVELTLPGENKSANLHKHCQDSYVRENAKQCRHCGELMAHDIVTVTLPGSTDRAELHERCKAEWSKLNARQCDHCQQPMVNDMVNISGGFGDASVHERCCDAFEAELRKKPKATSRPVGQPVQRTSPARGPAGRASVKCAECCKTTADPTVSITGSWGIATVHVKCQEAFEKKRRRSDPGVGVGGGGRCEHCLQRFIKGHDVPIMLTLPGSTRMVELHPACKDKWARAHGTKCDECAKPMVREITTLTGAFGTAEVHAECAHEYERRLKLNGGRKPPSRASTSPRHSLT